MTGQQPPWVPMARRALVLAIGNDLRAAAMVTQLMFDVYGKDSLVRAVIGWIDTMLVAQNPLYTPGGAREVALVFRAEGSGELTNLDEVQPEVVWAGRLVSARAADDRDMFNALLDTVPPAEHGRYVATLLSTIGATLRGPGGGARR